MEQTTEQNKLAVMPVGKLLVSLAMPAIAAQIVNLLYNMVDRIYIGHIPGVGSLALTGLGVTLPVVILVAAFAALVGFGGAPRASIAMGKGDYETAEKVVKTIADEFAVGVREIILNTHTKVIDDVKVSTIRPKKTKFILFGFFAGLIIGIGIIFLIDYLDDTIKGKKELEKILPIPVLGELPLEKEMMKK